MGTRSWESAGAANQSWRPCLPSALASLQGNSARGTTVPAPASSPPPADLPGRHGHGEAGQRPPQQWMQPMAREDSWGLCRKCMAKNSLEGGGWSCGSISGTIFLIFMKNTFAIFLSPLLSICSNNHGEGGKHGAVQEVHGQELSRWGRL